MSYRLFESSSIAKDYALYRPAIPDHVTDAIIDQLQIKKSANQEGLVVVDIGCGSGQFTQSLARHFDQALGFDISEAQIEEARSQNKYDHVHYGISSAEKIPLESETVDLVAVSQAAHWFDFPTFCREANRVLRPGGQVVVVSTIRKTINHTEPVTESVINECNDTSMRVLNTHRLISLDELDTFYRNLKYPYDETKRDCIGVKLELSSTEYLNMIKTMSYSLQYREKNPDTDFFEELENSLQATLQTRAKREEVQRFQLTLWHDIFMGQKPIS